MGQIVGVKYWKFPICEICGHAIDVRKPDTDWRCECCGKQFCTIASCGFDLVGESNVLVIPDKSHLVGAEIICKECGTKNGIRVK